MGLYSDRYKTAEDHELFIRLGREYELANLPEALIRDLVLMKLNAVGLRGARDLMPSEISGGMRRRVALIDSGSYRNDPAHAMQNALGHDGAAPAAYSTDSAASNTVRACFWVRSSRVSSTSHSDHSRVTRPRSSRALTASRHSSAY